jgi:hypothetical protein
LAIAGERVNSVKRAAGQQIAVIKRSTGISGALQPTNTYVSHALRRTRSVQAYKLSDALTTSLVAIYDRSPVIRSNFYDRNCDALYDRNSAGNKYVSALAQL